MTAGTKLGSYEILAPLGRGGMGEVYRARDTRLAREVAVKMVSAALARDPERVARFEREAKLLASLNHPHIAAIYGPTIAWPKNSAAVAWVGSTATPTNRSEGFQMLGKIVSHYLPSRKNSPVAACGAGLRARENEDAIRG